MMRVPRETLSEALASCPDSFVVHGRVPDMDIALERQGVYYGMRGSPEAYIWDHNIGALRQPNKDDMVKRTRLG